ncbi:atrial natriuretic peptide receptor 2-like [Paroedura picta]|uniref:atrial natriuretic peptide receptor 2-like n=1 Tax=Paroedura picta TaxID=143630 RepID=UPI004055B6F4
MASPPPLFLLQAQALLLSTALASPGGPLDRWSDQRVAAAMEVTVGVVVPERNVSYLWAWPRVAPALELALEALQPQLRRDDLDVNIAFAPADKDGDCSEASVLESTRELKSSWDPDVLLGLGCDYTDLRLRGWAKQWGLPLLLAGDDEGPFDSTTVVYAGPAGLAHLTSFLRGLNEHFNWTSPIVLAFSRQAHDFPRYFNILRGNFSRWTRIALDDQLDGSLQDIRAHGRVVYIHGSPEMVQQMMRLAQAQNMTNGDYVFIYLDFLGESLEAVGHREAAKPWQSKEGPDPGSLREAFQTVLIITFHRPQTPEYQRFQSELILRAQGDFGVALNDSQHKNLVAGCFHDGLLLYIRSLIVMLREGGSKRSTEFILENMRSLKIQGVTEMMSINEKNERKADFDLWSMADMESGEYQVVGRYMGTMKQIKWLGPIHWKQGGPPLSNPPCVFSMDDPSCDKGECI